MKFIFFVLTAVTILFSCAKDPADPVPPIVPVDSIKNLQQISLAYQHATNPTGSIELIVTDSLANYLLDTMLSVNDKHTVKFLSNESKFNITTIDFNTNVAGSIDPPKNTLVQTFYQVKPDNWNINQQLEDGFYDNTDYNSAPQSQIFYNNVPTFQSDEVIQYGNGSGMSYDGYNKNIKVFYQRPVPYYSFLLYSKKKLYKFYETTKINDTVSLTKMDTALTLEYQKPFALSDSFRIISGYKTKNDKYSITNIWNSGVDRGANYDMLYPPTGVEQYLIQYIAYDKNNKVHYTQKLSDAMPTTMEFLDDSYVAIVKNDPKDFEIAFPKALPTFYTLNFSAPNFFWLVYLPADKKTIKGTDKLIDLSKSKMLKAFNFTTLHFDDPVITKADNLDYTNYLNKIFDPAASTSKDLIKLYMVY